MVDLFLHDGGRELSQAVSRFKEILLETLAENLPPRRLGRSLALPLVGKLNSCPIPLALPITETDRESKSAIISCLSQC
jgi:hypothetical protein